MVDSLRLDYQALLDGKVPEEDTENWDTLLILHIEVCKMKDVEDGSRSGKLWLNFTKFMAIVRMFIRAERTGNWGLHLEATYNMLPFLARTGVKYVLSNTNTNTNTFFSRVSNTNTNTNTAAKIWSNTNTNTAHQIQIQIHNEAETKLPPFYRWHIQIHCIVRRLFCLFKFHWKLFPKVQSTVISLHWFR